MVPIDDRITFCYFRDSVGTAAITKTRCLKEDQMEDYVEFIDQVTWILKMKKIIDKVRESCKCFNESRALYNAYKL